MKKKRKTAGELSQEALKDNTKYNAREVGEAMCADTEIELQKCIDKYRTIIDEDEFCLVRLIASDPLIKNAKRFKYYAWPYLPSPRPNQAVFLYNKKLDKITKRLWVLPNAILMSKLASVCVVPKEYETMQAWSIAFYDGKFWEFIRYQHGITMPSEHEYFLAHRDELIKAGCKIPDSTYSEPFDFSKIGPDKLIDAQEPVLQ